MLGGERTVSPAIVLTGSEDRKMLNSSIIQVAIGLIFVFALVSILVTQINSVLTSLLKLRSRNLKASLQEMLTDSQIQARLLAHPVINLVDVAVPQVKLSAQQAQEVAATDTTRVTYIKPSIFVEALISIVTAETEDELYKPLHQAVNTMPPSVERSQLREYLRSLRAAYSEQTVRAIYTTIDEIPDEPTRTMLLQSIQDVENDINQLRFKNDELAVLMNSMKTIDDPRLRDALQTVLSGAQSLQQARLRLEEWFNENMNRASNAFQRKMQIVSLFVALTVAVVANIDALHIGRMLWEDPELRQALALAALEFDEDSLLDQTQPPATENGEAAAGDDETSIDDVIEEYGLAQDTVQVLLDLQLPIGWQFTKVTDEMVASAQALGLPDPRNNPRNFRNLFEGNLGDVLAVWFNKIVGILATTIAAAQGAPFWFDLLNRARQISSSK